MSAKTFHLLGALLLIVCLATGIIDPVFAQGNPSYTVKVVQVDSSRFPEISVWVSVTDAQGIPVTSLPASAFLLTEDGKPVTVSSVSHSGDQEAGAVSAILALDRSGSMKSSGKMDAAKAAATSFVDQMRSTDNTGVIAFNSQVQVVQPLTSDRDALRRAIASIEPEGNTSIYDALSTSVDMLANAPGRRAILLLSDGLDNSSKQTIKTLLDKVKGAELNIDTIGLGDTSLGTNSVAGIDEASLRAVAEQSRGVYSRVADPNGLAALYQQLSRQLQNEYRLTYISANTLHNGVGRGIDVQVVGAGGAQAAYNPGGIIPETSEALTWPVFGALLLGLIGLLAAPTLVRYYNNSGRSIPGLRRKSRVKLTGMTSPKQQKPQPQPQNAKPRVRVQGKQG